MHLRYVWNSASWLPRKFLDLHLKIYRSSSFTVSADLGLHLQDQRWHGVNSEQLPAAKPGLDQEKIEDYVTKIAFKFLGLPCLLGLQPQKSHALFTMFLCNNNFLYNDICFPTSPLRSTHTYTPTPPATHTRNLEFTSDWGQILRKFSMFIKFWNLSQAQMECTR